MAGPSAGVLDPVCGMTVDPAAAPASLVHDGATYYFCNPGCARRFQADPQRYLGATAPEPMEPPKTAPGERVEYTCPMHPEVVQDHPGSCPKCGMALEPRTAAADDGPNPELRDMRRRFIVGAVLTAPLVVLHFLHLHDMGWFEFSLATVVVFECGWPFFVRAAA
jgi:Cu+-exporting ATPase